jgi:hypothetical protein
MAGLESAIFRSIGTTGGAAIVMVPTSRDGRVKPGHDVNGTDHWKVFGARPP